MEVDACISESASETAANKQNNSNPPTQHANKVDEILENSDNKMVFKVPPCSQSLNPGVQLKFAATASLQQLQVSSPNHQATVENDNEDPHPDDNNEKC